MGKLLVEAQKLTVVIVASCHVAKFQSQRMAGQTIARIVTSIESAIWKST